MDELREVIKGDNQEAERIGDLECAPSSIPPMWEPADGRPQFVDEDWHAVRQAICKGVERAE